MPPPVPQKKKPSKWLWVVVAVAVIAVIGSLSDDKKDSERTSEPKPVASGSPTKPPAHSQVAPTQPTTVTPPVTPPVTAPQDEWVSAVGKIEAGVTVYFRNDPNSQPDAWFTVINPFVDGPDGPQMLVKYAASGDTEYLDRRATMRSPAAHNGQLVIRRSEAKY
jgi:hypothetical protein